MSQGTSASDSRKQSSRLLSEKEYPPTGFGVPLGWERPVGSRVGFLGKAAGSSGPRQLVEYAGDGHLISFGPTGSGKFVGAVGPELATYPGSVICIDPKGEGFTVFARRRRELGQRVLLLDPFQVVPNAQREGLNPLDLIEMNGGDAEADCEMLAAIFSDGHEFATDRYWTDMGRGIVSGLLDDLRKQPAGKRTINGLRSLLYEDDLDYTLAKMLDEKGRVPHGTLARDEMASYLTAPSDKTRPSIRTTAQTFVKGLGSRRVAEILDKTTFPLELLKDEGEPFSLFLVFPPRFMNSHRSLLRLLVHTLLSVVSHRDHIPHLPTLFIGDEAGQWGQLPVLTQAITLYRGKGVLVHTFWQDMSQVHALYGMEAETIINNCAVMQVLGIANHRMAQQFSEVIGLPAGELLNLTPQEQVLTVRGSGPMRCRKLDYLRDAMCVGTFDPNPVYRNFSVEGLETDGLQNVSGLIQEQQHERDE
jgi:type IV secretion system protein VirD4